MDSHSGFARRKELPTEGAGKNGVLVPLPPWAKEPAAGAAEYYFCGGVPFCLPKKEPKMPRGLSPRSASTPVANPRTPLRGTLPWGCSAHPARAGKGIAVLSAPLALAGQFSESPAGWTRKTRLESAAVGAGVLTGPSFNARRNNMAQTRRTRWERRAKTLATQGPSGPGGDWTATQVLPAGRNFPPKGPGKTAFWFLCRRGQRNPPPERRNFLMGPNSSV